MPRHAREVLVLTLLASIAVTGCSSPDNQTKVGDGVGQTFTAQALSVCATAQKSKDAWSTFPAPGFDPTKPDAADFPEVGAWLENEVSPTFDAWLDDLTALGTPPTGHEAWTDVLTAVGKISSLNAVQVQAAKSNDPGAFVDATNGLQNVQPELERATAAAGVPKCAEVHAG